MRKTTSSICFPGFLWLLVAAFALPLPSVTALANSPPIPCMSGRRGPGSPEQQKCLAEHVPGFGGYHQSGCTMIVYLTDLKRERKARKFLEPFSREMLAECGARASLEIRQGKYGYLDLYRWSTAASNLFFSNKATKLPGIGGVPLAPFPDNRIHLAVEKDATIARVKQILREHNIPLDAFVITSREPVARELASISIVPEIRHSGQRQRVVVPAILWGGKRDGDLVLGDSTLADVVTMLPPFPGHGPGKPSGRIGSRVARDVRQVLERITREYSPAGTQTIVGFDRNERLIFIQTIIEPAQAERFARELGQVATMHETYRKAGFALRHGSLTPCVLVETTARVEKDGPSVVNEAAYFYTCATGR